MSTTAFVFPGQGSQQIGMLSDLAAQETLIQHTFSEASDALGYDLWDQIQNGDAAQLNQTHITQPALLTAGVALWRLWVARGGMQPAYMAGHSLGEYTALACSGSLAFTDAVLLVEQRGRFMQSAVPAGTGGMAAIIGLDDALVIEACVEAAQSEVVEAVNFNSPGQIVIAGNSAAVERAMVLAKAKGAKRALPLPVSVPSHCALMRPAALQLAESLSGITLQVPGIPVVQNVTAGLESVPSTLKQNLVEQLYRPVLWTKSVEFLVSQGVTRTLECGPGKVLCGLNRRIDKNLSVGALGELASFETEFHAGAAS
jgi:[acyl-carrier-protein] S-malonyltransferase